LASGIFEYLKAPQLFESFWIAGFESASHINPAGQRLDMIAGVQHDRQAAHDYSLLREMGVRSARDGLRWHLIDRGCGKYDFSSFLPMLQAAEREGIQVLWDVCHYGWPDDIDLFSSEFVSRFGQFSAAVARVVRENTDRIAIYTPINEISFLTWAASRDMIFPHAFGRDDEIKCQLVRAAIACIEGIRSVDPRARFVFAEPIIHVVPPRNRPDLEKAAAIQDASQWESWDMIAGKVRPELGGNPKYLDIIGVNYYHSNQWEHPDVRLRWEDNPLDDRWVPFYKLLDRVYKRYQRPIFVAETSHFGIGRPRWIREIAWEVYQARRHGTPVEGICIYPILDRYDWADPTHWHNSGLWDLAPDETGNLRRVLNEEYAAALRCSQKTLTEIGCV
jgi:beta-glucosidase/6-phospho-beta-glucosidase/beta-galactosidase